MRRVSACSPQPEKVRTAAKPSTANKKIKIKLQPPVPASLYGGLGSDSLEASTCSGWVGASLLPRVGYAPSSPCWQHVEMGYLGGGPHGGQIGLPTWVLCKDGDRGGRGWDTAD